MITDALTEGIADSHLAYWKQQLEGAPPLLQLPTDYPRKQAQTFNGATISLVLPQSLAAALQALSRQEGVSLFTLLLTAFKTLLYRYTEQEDILVGTPVANYNSSLVGANTLVLRTNLADNPSFKELLSRVHAVTVGAYAHQDLLFEQMVEILQLKQMSHAPFQVMFHLNNTSKQAVEIDGLYLGDFEIASKTAQVDLILEIVEAEGLSCLFRYNTELFDVTTIKRMLGHYRTLLEGIVASPEQHLLTLPLLTNVERHQMLVEWNDTSISYQNQCVHQMIEAQVEQTPDAIALIFEDQQLTYRELNSKANQLASFLRKCGVKPEVLVGIYMERSLEIVVGILGILKAGGAYVPLDPAYPQERLNFILEETQVPVLLTQQSLVERLPQHGVQLICIDNDFPSQQNDENLNNEATEENLAYVIYTSGSTGKPKGVMIEHASLSHYVQSIQVPLSVTADDKYLHVASFAFSASIRQLIVPLLQGASVIIATSEQRMNPLELFSLIKQRHVTIADIGPSLWRSCSQALTHLELKLRITLLDNKLRLIASSSELLLSDLPRNWTFGFKHSAHLICMYGQTETTGIVTVYPIPDQDEDSVEVVSIGRPIANTQIYLLNSHLQPQPIGIPGEVYIGGLSLGRGYLNHQLTAKKFIPNPFSTEPGARLYKTGDLGCYLPDGTIEFLSRIDDQVKIRGMRVELGEIEAVLRQHTAVQQAVVIKREDTPGAQQLVAYVVPNKGQEPMFSELRSFLRAKLPEYMVPSAFVLLSTLPLNPNGKINRRALPAPAPRQPHPQSIVAPRDLLEDQLKNIWQEVLGVETIGIKDNFFDLGGHSLLVMRLVAQIEKISGKNLPLATLLEAPTIEQLANLLRQEEWSAPWRSLVTIHSNGSQPPFFCMHPIGGTVLFYQRLTRYLPDRPLYGLQSQGLNGTQPPYTQVVDMAAHYIKEIYTVQPEGPYFLGGFSFGGLVAFEMAQQLQAQGQKVALLALFDTPSRGYLKRSLLSWSFHHLNKFLELGPNYILSKTKAKIKRLQEKMPEVVRELGLNSEQAVPDALRSVIEANLQATHDYVPRVYSGRVDLFRAIYQKAPVGCYFDPQLGWGSLAIKGLEIHEVPSHHHSLFSEPQIQALAEKLQACLKQSHADNGVAKKANRLFPYF